MDLEALAAWIRGQWDEERNRAERLTGIVGSPSWNTSERPDTEVPPHRSIHVESEPDWCIAEACCGALQDRQGVAAHIARWDPAHALADLASKRALLDDLMGDAHLNLGNLACASLRGGECGCGRDDRVLRRLRILARPLAGDGMPDELREGAA